MLADQTACPVLLLDEFMANTPKPGIFKSKGNSRVNKEGKRHMARGGGMAAVLGVNIGACYCWRA